MNAEMTTITAKQLVGPLTDQRDFDVLPGAFADEVHWNNRGRCDRFFEASDDLRKRVLKCGSREGHGGVARRQCVSRLCSGGQFVIGKA